MAQHGFGIIGCGMIAEFHTRAINEIKNARVVGAWSRNAANADKIAGWPRAAAAIFDDLDALLATRILMLSASAPPAAPTWSRPSGPPGPASTSSSRSRSRSPCRAATRSSTPATRRRPALHDLPVAVHPGQPPAQGGDRPGPLRPPDPGRHLRQMVAHPALLRFRRLARHLAARRRRALMNQAIHNVDLLYWLMGDVADHSATATLAHERIEVEDTAVAALAIQERRARRDRSGDECLSRPAQTDRDPRRPRLGPRRARRHHALGIPGESPERQRGLCRHGRPNGLQGRRQRPAGITHIGHRDQLVDFLTRSTTAASPPSTAAKDASRSRSSGPSIVRSRRDNRHAAARPAGA